MSKSSNIKSSKIIISTLLCMLLTYKASNISFSSKAPHETQKYKKKTKGHNYQVTAECRQRWAVLSQWLLHTKHQSIMINPYFLILSVVKVFPYDTPWKKKTPLAVQELSNCFAKENSPYPLLSSWCLIIVLHLEALSFWRDPFQFIYFPMMYLPSVYAIQQLSHRF